MKKFTEKLWVVVAAVLVWGTILMLAGCSVEVSGRAFYPGENGGDIYKSRGVEKNNTGSWSWGDADKQ